jgi:phage shock protein A
MPEQNKSGNTEPSPPAPETFAAQAMRLLDGIESEIQNGHGQAWKAVLERAVVLAQPLTDGRPSADVQRTSLASENSDDLRIEKVYYDLQSQLVLVRNAVAQTIAAEKRIEQQLQLNKDQSETWLTRAILAEKQKKYDLNEQALQRKAQYDNAAVRLNEELIEQKKRVVVVRQKLTDLEAKVQEAYTQKTVLHARSKAAQAAIVANEIFARINADDALAELKKLESKVVELEARAANGIPESVLGNQPDQSKTLTDAIATLQMTIDAIARLELLVAKPDPGTQATSNEPTSLD